VQRTFAGLLLGGLLVFAAPEMAEADWHFTPLGGFTFLGDTSIAHPADAASKVHWHFGGAVALIGDGPIGIEGVVMYTPSFFGPIDEQNPPLVNASHAFALMGNVVLATPRTWNEYGLRPFVSGGIGLHRASVTDLQGPLVTENLVGFNIGGGAIGFITERTGLRFDLRHFSTLRRPDQNISFGPVRLSYWTGSVGVVFRY
jgi:hypothetical protein